MKRPAEELFEEGLAQYKADRRFREQISRSKKGRSAMKGLLAAFAQRGDLAMMQDLITRGVSVDTKDKMGQTPLLIAAAEGQVEAVRLLIQHGATVDSKGPKNVTPLMMGTWMGHSEVVRVLLEQGANPNWRSKDSMTPLRLACESENAKIVGLLLQAGADVGLDNNDGVSPLTYAAGAGTTQTLKVLLRSGVSLSEPDGPGMRACAQAAAQGRLDSLKILFKCGANVNCTQTGLTLLHFAAKAGQKEVAVFLLDQGSDANASDNPPRVPPLTLACVDGHLEVARLLLEHGADVNHETVDLETPLTIACKTGHAEIVGLLLEHGADIHFRDHRGCTPIWAAVETSNIEAVKQLISGGADLALVDSRGRSLLELAVRENNTSITRLLAEAGADVNAAVSGSGNLLELATKQRSTEIIELIQSHGAQYPDEMDQQEKTSLLVKRAIINDARKGNYDKAIEELLGQVDNEAKLVNAQLVLEVAAQNGHKLTVKRLLEEFPKLALEKAFLDASQNGNRELLDLFIKAGKGTRTQLSAECWEAALKNSVMNGDRATMRLLTRHYSITKHHPEIGETLLALAALNAHNDLTKDLWKWGFGRSEGRLTSGGMILLQEAIREKDYKSVERLLKHGTLSVECLAEFEDSIIVMLVAQDHIELAKKVLEKGADVGRPGRRKRTALMTAANDGNTEMVKLLLFRGADLNAVDDQDRTALDHAIARNRIEIIRLLKASGAKRAKEDEESKV